MLSNTYILLWKFQKWFGNLQNKNFVNESYKKTAELISNVQVLILHKLLCFTTQCFWKYIIMTINIINLCCRSWSMTKNLTHWTSTLCCKLRTTFFGKKYTSIEHIYIKVVASNSITKHTWESVIIANEQTTDFKGILYIIYLKLKKILL